MCCACGMSQLTPTYTDKVHQGQKILAAYQCNCIYNILIHGAQSILKSEEASASSAS